VKVAIVADQAAPRVGPTRVSAPHAAEINFSGAGSHPSDALIVPALDGLAIAVRQSQFYRQVAQVLLEQLHHMRRELVAKDQRIASLCGELRDARRRQ